MVELITLIILLASVIGIGVIIFKNLPVLADLPESSPEKKESIGFRLKQKIKEVPSIKNFSHELVLQKFISKIRMVSLKTDHQTFNWLQKLRERTKNKKLKEDGYWEEIKKISKKD